MLVSGRVSTFPWGLASVPRQRHCMSAARRSVGPRREAGRPKSGRLSRPDPPGRGYGYFACCLSSSGSTPARGRATQLRDPSDSGRTARSKVGTSRSTCPRSRSRRRFASWMSPGVASGRTGRRRADDPLMLTRSAARASGSRDLVGPGPHGRDASLGRSLSVGPGCPSWGWLACTQRRSVAHPLRRANETSRPPGAETSGRRAMGSRRRGYCYVTQNRVQRRSPMGGACEYGEHATTCALAPSPLAASAHPGNARACGCVSERTS